MFFALVFIQLLRGWIWLRVVADLLVVRDNDSFGLEFRSAFYGYALVIMLDSVDFQLLIWIDLGACLRLNVRFAVYCAPQVPELVRRRLLQMIAWHRHLGLGLHNGLLVLNAINRVDSLVLLVQVIERFRIWWIHPLVAHLLQSTLF